MSKMRIAFAALALAMIQDSAFSAQIDWWDIQTGSPSPTVNGFASGVIHAPGGDIALDYTGAVYAVNTGTGGNLWLDDGGPLQHYTGNPVIGNLPPANDRLRLDLAAGGTLQFGQPVQDPVMLIRSLGNNSQPVAYTFDTPFVLLSHSPGAANPTAPDPYFEINGNTLRGWELHGAVQFPGMFSSITWSLDEPEFFQEIIFGVPQPAIVPLPAALPLLGTALAGLFGINARRRRGTGWPPEKYANGTKDIFKLRN